MTRREFSIALAGSAALPVAVKGNAPEVVIFQAIAGAHLPATLAITTSAPEILRQGVWELRTYRGATPEFERYLADIFSRAGIRPLSRRPDGPDLTYFIPFDNLTARDRAWTAVNADPQWIGARTQFQSYHFGLYLGLY